MNAAVTLVVLAVAAGTFVLSYEGVHAIALQGGVSDQLARVYPGLFDAVLVIACVAAVMLRDARWWARCWAWLVVIVLLGAIGATDVLHAMDYGLRHRPTEGVVAAAPVLAVLLAFSLLLTMLRQSRPQVSDATPSLRGRAGRHAAGQQSIAPTVATAIDAIPVPVVAAGAVPRPPAPPIALPPAPEPVESAEAAEAVAADEHIPDPATAPTREEPALFATALAAPDTALTPDLPVAADDSATPDNPNPPTEPNEVVAAEAPSPPPSPPLSPSPAVAQVPPPEPSPGQAPQPTARPIRYASSAAGESAADYWDSDVDPALAGQVYPVLTSDLDIDTSGYQPDEPPEVDDSDAPPFATAPFASVPRLNRMRVTPIPPTEDGDLD